MLFVIVLFSPSRDQRKLFLIDTNDSSNILQSASTLGFGASSDWNFPKILFNTKKSQKIKQTIRRVQAVEFKSNPDWNLKTKPFVNSSSS